MEGWNRVNRLFFSVNGKYTDCSAPGAARLNFGSKTLMPETTLARPGIVKAVWLSYCPTLLLLKFKKNKNELEQIKENKKADIYVYLEIKMITFQQSLGKC